MYAAVKCVLLLSVAFAASGHSLGPNDVVFHLFTRQNPQQSIPVLPNFDSLLNSQNFGPARRTIIGVPTSGGGFAQFGAHFVNAHINAEDVNVFVVDWSAGSSMYTQGLAQSPQCGTIIANFVNMIIREFSIPVSNFRIVGHGLGGHIAGIAARQITGTVPHIVALDPSLHGWTHHPARLSSNDATIVEVVQTTAGLLGYDQPLGTLNFYANGGTHQPNCGTTVSCSHDFAFIFYADSITSDPNRPKFVGTKCQDYQQALASGCSGVRDATFGGVAIKTSGSGVYWFATNLAAPFGQN